MTPWERLHALGADRVLEIVTRGWRPTPAVQRALRRVVSDGAVVAGEVPASVLLALGEEHWLTVDHSCKPLAATAGPRMYWAVAAATVEQVPRDVVAEYLAALDARRELVRAMEGVKGADGKRLRGTALANKVRAAQKRLDAAEGALRAAAVRGEVVGP